MKMKTAGNLCVIAMFAMNSLAGAKPLKVFILAGQSNMQGHAVDYTLTGMAKDPVTRPLYDKIVDENGKPRVFENVHITYLTTHAFGSQRGTELRKAGKLTIDFAGNGYRDDVTDKFGPELPFGAVMSEAFKDDQVLLIKTAWGGTNLHHDWYPPGAPAHQSEKAGHLYRAMMKHVNEVLANPARYCPACDPKQGYQIAGFVWFQGWNDMMDSKIYPGAGEGKPGAFDLYSDLLARFIRDVRKDLKTPGMPFVIGVAGFDGKNARPGWKVFRKAMAAPASLPEFRGNVAAVSTAKFWDEKLAELLNRKRLFRPGSKPVERFRDVWDRIIALQKEQRELRKGPKETQAKRNQRQAEIEKELTKLMYSPEELEYMKENQSNAGYHYNGSGKTYARIGEAFARSMLELMKNR